MVSCAVRIFTHNGIFYKSQIVFVWLKKRRIMQVNLPSFMELGKFITVLIVLGENNY